MFLVRFIRRLIQKYRIKHCDHRPWVILQFSGDLLVCGWIALEFKRRKERPPDAVRNCFVAVCTKCGGITDDITFANNALGDKDSVLVFHTVYQATNWIYTGLSAKRTNWTIKGVDKHCQTIADKFTAKQLREIYGDRFSLQPRSRKHRYVTFIAASKKRRKELLRKLKYPILPYPKEQPGETRP